MTDARWNTVLSLFDAVRDLPAGDRPALLAERCGTDEALRREVESLLNHDQHAAADFLRPGESRLPATPHNAPDPLLGATVASFKVKSVLAAGGMGTVYLAEQAHPRREVALKVMRPGLWSKSVERRFEYESQILARLRHPNIAQVYEAGTAEVSVQPSATSSRQQEDKTTEGTEDTEEEKSNRHGSIDVQASIHLVDPVSPVHSSSSQAPSPRPQLLHVSYFAMEYIPGARTITQYADEHALTQRQRLDLFLQVCDAVNHGHQRGIIHRDLKPGNILVGCEDETSKSRNVEKSKQEEATPHPGSAIHDSQTRRGGPNSAIVKIIDFGVARMTDSDVAATTMHTETGALIGTLAYMSPEQCEADPLGIDIRSDVYSLGVVLYELLCGRLPYDVSRTSIVKAARTICEHAPDRPSLITGKGTLLPRVDGDLEFLLLKTLEKDRRKRYASAAELAAEIGRYLNKEPLAARPPTLFTRTLRWAARRRVRASSIAGMLSVVLMLGGGWIAQKQFLHQPNRVKLSEDERLLSLYSRSDGILHTWDSGKAGGIRGAQVVNDPVSGRRLAVIGFAFDSTDFPGQLCAFDIDSETSKPAWSRTVDQNQMPDDLKKRGPAAWDFGVRAYLIADVFPGEASPGEEIIVSFNNSRSQQPIRIYNLRGDLLFQVWQNGGVSSFHWMSGAGLLACAGGDERYKDIAENHGHRALRGCTFAPCVFAVRPELHTVSNDYLSLYPPKAPVAWCHWFDPASSERLQIAPTVDGLVGASDPRLFMSLNAAFHLASGGMEPHLGSVMCILDAAGKEVGTRREADTYSRNRKSMQVPPLEFFQLSNEPPTRVWQEWMLNPPASQPAP